MSYPADVKTDTPTKDPQTFADSSDVEKESSLGASQTIVEETARVLDHKAERALCRKFDFRLLPVLAVMCES